MLSIGSPIYAIAHEDSGSAAGCRRRLVSNPGENVSTGNGRGCIRARIDHNIRIRAIFVPRSEDLFERPRLLMSDVLKVETREKLGKRNSRRLRRAGGIPATLYGHGEAPVSLACSADEFAAAMRHGVRLVNLTGASSERAFIRDLQWDTFGQEVLHIDLTRVSEDERVEVEVPIELRGEAPGAKEGGVVELQLHQLPIECRVVAIPEKIEVNINELELDQTITVADLELPDGVKVLESMEATVVSCSEPVELPEEEEEIAGESAEPEVIGRAAEEGEDSSD